ncbi:TPA: DUF4035 domain-containing protein [Klebsiella aerogenes]|nr:DUF4035 domain-containing protein [Klebsiella aerogenes]
MRFLMSLALRMGRTLAELRATMSAGELQLWAEYDRTSPLSDVRGDFRTAQIVAAVYGAQGVKVPLSDALLRWDEEDKPQKSGDPFAGLEAALAKAAR